MGEIGAGEGLGQEVVEGCCIEVFGIHGILRTKCSSLCHKPRNMKEAHE